MVITDSLAPRSDEALTATDPGRRAHAIQEEQDIARQMRQLRSGGYAIEIPSAAHRSFGGTRGDPEIRSVIRAFATASFARHLRGSAADISQAVYPWPLVRFRSWPPSAGSATTSEYPILTSAISASSRGTSR
ncbi:hypothetical protein ACU4GR_02710 [Methylobacterium oryzae CBMB20]